MLLSSVRTISIDDMTANYIGHMCYAASKLWNVCNFECRNWKSLGLAYFPDWYYQKKHHKNDIWYKNLPSQTAQEVCKVLHSAWSSYFSLVKYGSGINPKPPRFKTDKIPVTYMQNGMRHNDDTIRLAIPKQLKKHMAQKYGHHADYLYMKHNSFIHDDHIKQLHVYPPVYDGKTYRCKVIVVYEIADRPALPDNGHYLSIDMGVHNFLSCMDSLGCNTFIVGREYLSICRRFDKEIARVQSAWYTQQSTHGIQHPVQSKHIQKLYDKKHDHIHNYLHQMTAYIVSYCVKHHINTVIIGDITGIRNNKNYGHVVNQQFHGLPYAKIYMMLEYKLKKYGITLVKQNEAYSSQCSPMAQHVSKKYATPEKRVHRGLYSDGRYIWNADSVGAYNIMRLYLHSIKRDDIIKHDLTPNGLSSPVVIKVVPYKKVSVKSTDSCRTA